MNDKLVTRDRDPLCAFRLPPEMRTALDAAAEAEGTTLSAVIRDAITDWLEDHETVTA